MHTIDGAYATFYPGHGIALLQKEAETFEVRQGSLFQDEVYVDAEIDGEVIEGRSHLKIVKNNLGIMLKEDLDEVPEPVQDRHIERIGFVRSPDEQSKDKRIVPREATSHDIAA